MLSYSIFFYHILKINSRNIVTINLLVVTSMAMLMVVYWRIMFGNVRAVVNGTTGAVEQSLAYYPYGGAMAI